MDFMGPDGGLIATSFGAGCVACWGFIQMALLGPMKKQFSKLEETCERRDEAQSRRIEQLETALLMHGTGPLREAVQKAISEVRVTGVQP